MRSESTARVPGHTHRAEWGISSNKNQPQVGPHATPLSPRQKHEPTPPIPAVQVPAAADKQAGC